MEKCTSIDKYINSQLFNTEQLEEIKVDLTII